jgi:hypothetical protein
MKTIQKPAPQRAKHTVTVGPTSLSNDTILRQVHAMERIAVTLGDMHSALANLNTMINQRFGALNDIVLKAAVTADLYPRPEVQKVTPPKPKVVITTTAEAAKAAGLRIFTLNHKKTAPVIVRATPKPAVKGKGARR